MEKLVLPDIVLPEISVITLGVSNIARAECFYKKGLGLQRAEKPTDVVYFKLNGSWLALYPYTDLANYAGVISDVRPTFAGVTLSCNVQEKDDVDRLMRQAVAAGGKEVKVAQVRSWGGYSGWLSDVENYLWEIVWNPHWPGK